MNLRIAVIAVCIALGPTLPAVSHSASANYQFPRQLECGTLKDISEYLAGKYEEVLLFKGTSMNKAASGPVMMFITANSKSGTYTFVNYYKEKDLACILDSGIIQLDKAETKGQQL